MTFELKEGFTISDMRIITNKKLAEYTTFHTGGRAKYFTEVTDIKSLKEAVEFAEKSRLKTLVLGGGSNTLLPDKDINRLVILMRMKRMSFEDGGESVLISAGAGESWDKIVARTVKNGLGGIENLSLIPGTLGGAIYQNIGAYGVELKDVLESVEVFDTKTGTVKILSNTECRFGYRDSIFQTESGKNYIIVGGILKLFKNTKPVITYPDLIKYFENITPTPPEIRKAVIKIRKKKLDYPTSSIGTVGSFFKNPIITSAEYQKLSSDYPDIKGRDIGDGLMKLFAGQLTEKAGWKNTKLGKAGVSAKHAMVLLSYRGAKSKDVLALAKKIQTSVKTKFKIILEPEVKIIR